MKVEVDVGRLLGSLSMRATRRRGEWYALCPNPDHDDRHLGSFTLTDDPGSDRHAHFRCYSCGAYGDAIDLVKLVLGVGYHAAVCWIEDSALSEEPLEPARLRVEIVQPKVFRLPAGVEELPLERWPVVFRRYLEQRRVPAWQVERWRLCFAIEGRLAGRIVIPTRSQSGKLSTYAARSIGRDRLRYLTPSREDGADLCGIFGEECWGPRGTVVVCEGGFDALAVERAAEDVAVAVLGGGGGAARSQNVLTAAVRKLARFEEVLLAHDGDDAGDRMAAELKAAIPRARRVRPPGGVDCAKMTERELRGIIRA